MTEYQLSAHSKHFSYNRTYNYVRIGSCGIAELSDNERSEFIADSLTHEHIHRVLCRLFDVNTSILFDTVQQYFRNTSLHEKTLRIGQGINQGTRYVTHHSFIKKHGINVFLKHYDINNTDMIQSYIICGGT